MSLKSAKVGIESGAPGRAAGPVAEAVVGGALLRIAEDAVRFGGFLEFVLGLGVVRVPVRMVLQRQLPVSALDL